jgi:hypothetical protein
LLAGGLLEESKQAAVCFPLQEEQSRLAGNPGIYAHAAVFRRHCIAFRLLPHDLLKEIERQAARFFFENPLMFYPGFSMLQRSHCRHREMRQDGRMASPGCCSSLSPS